MAADVVAYWPGASAEDLADQPGFFNDGTAWGRWVAARKEEPALAQALLALDAAALLAATACDDRAGVEEWVAPSELLLAARRVRHAVQRDDPHCACLVAAYRRCATEAPKALGDLLIDLADVEEIALWAEQAGIGSVRLRVI
jgi:hypothetical protein